MKVLLVSQYFWPENFIINDIASALSKEGIQITVLTAKPNYPRGKIFSGYKARGIQQDLYSGIELIRLPIIPRGNGSTVRLVLNYLSFIASAFVAAPWLFRKKKFDVVFVYAPSPLLQALPAVLLARQKDAALAIWVQDLWPEALSASGYVKSRWVLKGVESIVRLIYRHADSILIQSKAFYPSVASLVDDAEKIWHFPNTYYLPNPSAKNKNEQLIAELKKYFSFIFAGNIGIFQSLETILDAAENLLAEPAIRIFIIGDGSRSDWLAEEVKQRKLNNIVLVGRLPHCDMSTVFAAASALLATLVDMPGISLTIPNKLQAYLAAGKPIVASDNGACAQVVQEAKAGFTCPSGDWKALAETMLELYRLPPEKRIGLGANGRDYFNAHFDPKAHLKKLIGHFEKISAHVEKDI